MPRNPARKQQILETLALMLETNTGERITTSKLAAEVGVSEAALYRHFPSKVKMFEGLIEFIEENLFIRISSIKKEQIPFQEKCGKICFLLIVFAEKNPGLCRILTGESLTGDVSRLRSRVDQIFERITTQLKQILKEGEFSEGFQPVTPVSAIAGLLTAVIEGRIAQYVRSDFRLSPATDWVEQWQALSKSLFVQKISVFNSEA